MDDLEKLNKINKGTLMESLGIEFTAFGEDFIEATMPVDERTFQPMGLLHGGASLALAESIGSAGTYTSIDTSKFKAVCLEINGNHTAAVMSGHVKGRGELIHKGKSTHIWQVVIRDENGKQVCVSRMTMMIVPHK